jgi:hypothetical protein
MPSQRSQDQLDTLLLERRRIQHLVMDGLYPAERTVAHGSSAVKRGSARYAAF